MATPTLSGCVVLDIDGVLADVRHRVHYLDRKPKDWEGFFAAGLADWMPLGQRTVGTANILGGDVLYEAQEADGLT